MKELILMAAVSTTFGMMLTGANTLLLKQPWDWSLAFGVGLLFWSLRVFMNTFWKKAK